MSNIKQLKVDEVYRLFNNQTPNDIFIDVRTPSEWAEGTIPGVKKIVLDDLPDHIEKLEKDKHYIMICRSGNRSNNACKYFVEEGFSTISNFDGGMLSWEAMDYPTE